jgi:hypothetical protein
VCREFTPAPPALGAADPRHPRLSAENGYDLRPVSTSPAVASVIGMGSGQRESAFTLLAGALFLLVALAALLFLMLVRAPTGGARADVTPVSPVACQTGTHAPVCYQTTVTNVGSGAGQITCQVIAAVGTSAVFGNQQDVYTTPVDTPIAVNQSFKLTAMSNPLTGKTSVSEPPTITCSAVG